MTSRRASTAGLACLGLFIGLMWLYPLLTLRLTDQHDIPTHLRWAEQFADALRDGQLLPRWAHASLHGLGDPSFVYYQPLFYYVTSAFALLGLRSEYALLLAIIVPYVLLGAIVYRTFLGSYPDRVALAGALFVIVGPLLYFLSTNLGAYPWSLSLPFSVLFAAESSRERPRASRLGILLSLVCLSHLLSGLITLCATALGRLLFAFPSRRNLRGHLGWAAGVLLGLALAAFFIYPAVTQLKLINPAGWADSDRMWARAFVFPIAHARDGLRWAAIQWPLGVVTLATAALCLIPRQRPATPMQVLARRLAVVALAALLLSTELAYPLYATIKQMQMLQYPYRFVFIAAVLANLALAIHVAEGAWAGWGRMVRAAAVLLVLAQCALSGFLQVSLVRSGVQLPDRAHFMAGRFGQPEYLPAVHGPHWQQWVADGKLEGECKRLGIQCDTPVQRTHALSVAIDTPRALAVRLPVFAFPAWSLTVDGQPQALVPDPDTGLPLAQLAPGRHLVALRWTGTPADKTGRVVSLAALAVLLALLAAGWLRRGERLVEDAAAEDAAGTLARDGEELAPTN
jgi:hypothetical protein